MGIGIALMAGVALRLAALSGAVMMVLMWAAEWLLARHDTIGELTSSVNPFVDYHLIYAIAMIMIALTAGAGSSGALSTVGARSRSSQRTRSSGDHDHPPADHRDDEE